MPISSASDGTSNQTGTGEKEFNVMDLMLKYHLWFAQNAWVGLGFGFYDFSSGYLHYNESSTDKFFNLSQAADTKTLFAAYFGFGFQYLLLIKSLL